MKSTPQDLQRRGYIQPEDVDPYRGRTPEALYHLILSKDAMERSIAVRLLSQRMQISNINLVQLLLQRLASERALYTRHEICHALERGNIQTAAAMLTYLGRIGRNHHKELPKRVSKKLSYPLPRDLIARSLGRMDPMILPTLINALSMEDEKKVSELIDAIGFILYYNPDHQSMGYLRAIQSTMQRYRDHDVILWKCVICLSALWLQESIDTLRDVMSRDVDEVIRSEAERSIGIIEMKMDQ